MGPQSRFGVDDQRGVRAGKRSETDIILLVGNLDVESWQVALRRV